MKKKSAKSLIQDHVLKVLSLFFAVFLWFYVVNSEPILVKRTFKVKIKAPVGKAVNKLSHNFIEVELKGARAFVEDYANDDSSLILNLVKIKDKSYQYKITNKDFLLPFGVEINRISPVNIKVSFDRKIKKKVPIKIEEEGRLQSQLHFTKKKISPREIMIEGPISAMRKISTVKTEPIDLAELAGEGDVVVNLQELPRFISYERVTTTKLSYIVKPKSANYNLKNIEITFVAKTKKYFTKTKQVSMDILAPDDVRLKKSDIKVFADIPKSKYQNIKVRLRAELPTGVHLLQIHPPLIDVRLE